ncbi:MAG: DUF4914 family protein [Phycisphaerae bacterium]|nr:DUF4914 family protein [Phycisphaerae bacterium]
MMPKSRKEILSLAMGDKSHGTYQVSYDVNGKSVLEATVTKVKNGLAVNYPDPYMRRRDPECMLVADQTQTDKTKFSDRFSFPFADARQDTFDWLKGQDLVVTLFSLGGFESKNDRGAVLIAPANAGFFIGALADLQGMVPPDQVDKDFKVCSVIYLAPPFRQTHFDGKQVVVHNRLDDVHEIFSYNLYPGPSAKKGVYGVLLTIGETEDWPTLHASTVEVETPYDNVTTIMHEGASGGGKSEMLEPAHRLENGRLLLGKNVVNGEERTLSMGQNCRLYPVTDDMAICKPISENTNGYLIVQDAEEAWFVRVNHIQKYGTDPHLEALTVHPKDPLIFLNIDATPDSTALIWQHTEDAPGQRCPNPRVILPRKNVPDVVNGQAEVMVRSFGVRTPPCTRKKPSYGIIGYLHILPPALAWLWRLVAPRGHDNPSITDTEGMTSEGVGSYWPFATGRLVDQANLLLRQMESTPKIKYALIPNQHVGVWETGFMPQWISREYLARRGAASFRSHQLKPARCPLLGYAFNTMQVEGTIIPQWLLQVDLQREIGPETYDKGAGILQDFFDKELQKFLHKDLEPLGKDIITCCLDKAGLQEYESLLGRC